MTLSRRNARFARKLGKFIDAVNIVLGIAVVVMGILILVSGGENRILFPVLFLSECFINIFLSVKVINQGETGRFIALVIASGIMLLISIFAFIIVL